MRKPAQKPDKVRPNPKRQALFVLLAVAGLAAGYGLNVLFTEKAPAPIADTNNKPQPGQPPEAWYRSQASPPELITAAASPIFPESGIELPGGIRRAYEEALPAGVYAPPAPPPPPAMKKEPSAKPEPVLRKWRQFAVAAPVNAGKPRIILVIDDLGIDKKRAARAIGLPGPLTLSFISYATELQEQTAKARAAGHELMLHLSMEPTSKTVDPGPNFLMTGLSQKELLIRLRWGMGRFDSYVGINNHMGSRFTEDPMAMTIVLKEIKRRGLVFLDSRTSPRSVGGKLARRLGVDYAERNIFLDHVDDIAEIRARLRETERLARQRGYAIAIGHPREATLNALEPWLQTLEKKGFQLTPLSAVVRQPAAKKG